MKEEEGGGQGETHVRININYFSRQVDLLKILFPTERKVKKIRLLGYLFNTGGMRSVCCRGCKMMGGVETWGWREKS